MTDRAKEELARTIVREAARQYIASRRDRIDAFGDRHFTVAGSFALHRRALGWDLVRAPANLFLAGPALIVSLASLAAQKAGAPRLAAWLARRRILLETEVAREIEWLVATELLEVPCKRPSHASYRDAIAEVILADQRVLERLGGPLCTDSESCDRLVAVVENYLRSRNAAAEIATGFVAAGVGALAVKQVTPGLITLSSALSGMIAQQTAIAAFPASP